MKISKNNNFFQAAIYGSYARTNNNWADIDIRISNQGKVLKKLFAAHQLSLLRLWSTIKKFPLDIYLRSENILTYNEMNEEPIVIKNLFS